MKISFAQSIVTLALILTCSYTMGQQSANTVSYKVTYDKLTLKYTVWVVPGYAVPNANNSGATEKGATAQVTLAVPKSFVITNITDIKGSWEKNPLKLGPGQPSQDWSSYTLDPETNYYVIGKSAEETDYGSFTAGTDVSLFTFQGNGCIGIVRIIEPNEPFISAADNNYSLNVANSFYSRSGQPAGGNQNPLEQFKAVAGTPADCLEIPVIIATPDTETTTIGTPVTTTVLANDTRNGSPANIAELILTVTIPATKGTTTVNTNGTITYTPNPGTSGTDVYTYKICDKVQTTVCKETTVTVTINAPSNNTNLSITKTVDKPLADLNDVVNFTIVVKNNGPITATNIIVKDELPQGLTYISGADSKTGNVLSWSIPSLNSGETRTFTLKATVTTQGISNNTAQIESLDQTDTDLTDNSSTTCVSVPIVLCQGESLELSVPASFSNVQWFKDGQAFKTGNKISVTESGSYTNKSADNNCPTNNCCPVVVITQTCCPVEICIPITITKIR